MKKLFIIFAFVVFFACSDFNGLGQNNSNSSQNNNSSSSDISDISGSSSESSSSLNGGTSSGGTSSSGSSSSSSAGNVNNCAYQPSWCNGVTQNNIATSPPQSEGCFFATSINKFCVWGQNSKINGTDVGQGNIGCWSLNGTVPAKADGGYYIWVSGGIQEWGGTTGTGPTCTGNQGSSSSSNKSSSSSNSSSSRSSSSSQSSSSSSSSSAQQGGPSYPPLSVGQTGVREGRATRYWDGCKPSCSWSGKTQFSGGICKNCNISNNIIAAIDNNTSSCNGGNAFTCWDMAPYSVNANTSYGFVATPASLGEQCGKCYQIQFKGGSDRGNVPGISGKTLIAMASNIGYDVENDHFDILIPGGGVGAFDSFSRQLGVNNSELGAQYGGLLTTCNFSKSCLIEKCNSIFSGKPNLLNGCLWHANWLEAVDNPTILYKEIDCPQELINKYRGN